jgi:Flp pilus assembly protein TadD
MNSVRVAKVLAVAFLTLGSGGPVSSQGDDLTQASQLLKQGELERALAQVDSYLEKRPKDARGRFLKGVILTERKMSKEATRIFTDLTHDYPELPEPYNNLAVLHAAQGEYEQARIALEMAVRANPNYAVAHENLGDIYARMAARAYDKAAQLDRNNKTAPVKLNLVKELLSRSPSQ